MYSAVQNSIISNPKAVSIWSLQYTGKLTRLNIPIDFKRNGIYIFKWFVQHTVLNCYPKIIMKISSLRPFL